MSFSPSTLTLSGNLEVVMTLVFTSAQVGVMDRIWAAQVTECTAKSRTI